MRTLPLNLRERILTSYDRKEGTRLDIAARYRVSLGMVKKLLQQRRHIGDIRPQHYRSGRKPTILPGHEQQIRALLAREPNLTLKELRQAVALNCTLPAIHYALRRLGLTYKKRHSMPHRIREPERRTGHPSRGPRCGFYPPTPLTLIRLNRCGTK